MFGLGAQELLLILVIVLIFFGADKIPQLARSLGKGISEFKKAQHEVKEELVKDKETAATAILTPPDTIYANTFVTCQACKTQAMPDSQYCPQCGARLKSQEVCTGCGNQIQSEDKFCAKCGKMVGR